MLHLQGIHSSDAADVIRSTSETLVWGTSLLAHTSTLQRQCRLCAIV